MDDGKLGWLKSRVQEACMHAPCREREQAAGAPSLSQILPLQMAAVRRWASAVQTAASAAPRADSPLIQPPPEGDQLNHPQADRAQQPEPKRLRRQKKTEQKLIGGSRVLNSALLC